MPTYQYACTSCGHHLEAVQAFTDAALTECPACAGRLRKRFSSVGIVFKGSGFYRNDSRAPVKAEAHSNAASAAGTESKTGASEPSSTPAASDAKSSTPSKSSTPATASTSASAS